MALINLSYMAEFFFHETGTCDVKKAYFFSWLKVFEEFKYSKEVLVLNNGFNNNYTARFEIRVPTFTACLKIYEVFFIRLV